MNQNTVKKCLSFGKTFLKNAEIESYSIDAEILLMEVLNFSKVQLFTKDDYVLSKDENKKYIELLNKRKNFMPVQYITNKCEFMGLDFKVNNHTLIPRSDTEILVECAIKFIEENNFKTAIDIGTGSGAISVSIAKYCKNINVTAVDISEEALKIAQENASQNAVSNKIYFIQSNVFDKITSKFDIIISNPPYIKTDIIKTLMPQVKDFEPVSALDGGIDGLFFYKKIISECKNYLNANGVIIFEIGYDQANAVSELLKNENFSKIKVTKDLAGLNRVVSAFYNIN